MIKTIGGIAIDTKKKREIISHFADLPICAVDMEFKYFSLIHPNGEENVQDILGSTEEIIIDMKNDTPMPNLPQLKKSGIYGLVFDEKTIYIGETLKSFQVRINQHIESLKTETHFNKKLLKAYKALPDKKFKLVVFESSLLSEGSEAPFKLYCLFRERFYYELFYVNNYNVLNSEDSLAEMYRSWPFKQSGVEHNEGMTRFAYGSTIGRSSAYTILSTLEENSKRKDILYKNMYLSYLKFKR